MQAERKTEGPLPKELSSYSRVIKAKLSSGESVVAFVEEAPLMHKELELDYLEDLNGQEAKDFFAVAVKMAQDELKEMEVILEENPGQKGIISFQIRILDDPALHQGLHSCLDQGMNLPESMNAILQMFKSLFEQSENVYIQERTHDCEDVFAHLHRVIRHQQTNDSDDLSSLRGKIVHCSKIYPSQVIKFYKANVAGVISDTGTASSHAQILLESLNIPSLSHLIEKGNRSIEGQVIIDTENKQLTLSPEQEDMDHMKSRSQKRVREAIKDPVLLVSGEPVSVSAILNMSMNADEALKMGADGVGLFRSEMSYLNRLGFPSEHELLLEYQTIVNIFEGKPVVLRMLDIGGDKIALVDEVNKEENPCMGNRSMRLLIHHPEIFRTQLKAMLKAGNSQTTVLFPMVNGWYELEKVRDFVRQTRDELKRDHYESGEVKFGIMVEVPSIVARFEDYVSEFDLFNIGTNDLIQYTLAVDRNNVDVAEFYNSCHPAILSMIEKVCRLSHDIKRWPVFAVKWPQT